MGQIIYPETSVRNYQSSPRNNPEELSSDMHVILLNLEASKAN